MQTVNFLADVRSKHHNRAKRPFFTWPTSVYALPRQSRGNYRENSFPPAQHGSRESLRRDSDEILCFLP